MFQKSISHSGKKGFLQIDFAFALLIFFMFFFLVYSNYDAYRSNFEKDLLYSQINVDSRDLCYFLVNSKGFPNDWENDIENASFLGFRDVENNYLNSNKILAFNNSYYYLILEKLGLEGEVIYIKILGLETDNIYLDFGISSNDLSTYFSSNNCFSNYNSEPVLVYLEVWK